MGENHVNKERWRRRTHNLETVQCCHQHALQGFWGIDIPAKHSAIDQGYVYPASLACISKLQGVHQHLFALIWLIKMPK